MVEKFPFAEELGPPSLKHHMGRIVPVTRCPDSCHGNGFCIHTGVNAGDPHTCVCHKAYKGRACEETNWQYSCLNR